MNVNVVLLDNEPTWLEYMLDALREAASASVPSPGEPVTITLHPFGPAMARDGGIDIASTLQTLRSCTPGVAIIDLNLIADDDYEGAHLALMLKETLPDCCIILVSAYFAEAPALLDSVEVFRFRIDKNQDGFYVELQDRLGDAVRDHVNAAELRHLLDPAASAREAHAAVPPGPRVYVSCAPPDIGGPEETGAAPIRPVCSALIAAQIEDVLRAHGYVVKLDRTGRPEPWRIRRFLQTGTYGGCLMVIDDAYVRSLSCLQELLELFRHVEFHHRVGIVLLPDARIDDPSVRRSYLKYWQEQESKLRQLFDRINLAKLAPAHHEDLRRHVEITQQLERLLEFAAHRPRFSAPQSVGPDWETGLLAFVHDLSRPERPVLSMRGRTPTYPPGKGAPHQTITWLHLSDLHFCEPRYGWDIARVLRPLRADLREMSARYDLTPQFLFFTGDAAFGQLGTTKGKSLSEQFDSAEEVLDSTRNAFDPIIPKSHVFLVPGNHDVDRCAVTRKETAWLDRQRSVDPITNLIHGADADWRRFMARLAAYRSFLQRHGYDHLLTDSERLIYGEIRTLHDIKVGIIGLNTAWSCGRDDEKGRLWMGGDWQIGHLSRQTAQADFRIGLMHHPPSWLVEFEDPILQPLFEREFAFLLHGHEHQGWILPNGFDHVRIAASASYQGAQHENGYNFVKMDLTTGEISIWLRRYDIHGGGWVPLVIFGRTNIEGRWTLGPQRWLRGLVARRMARPSL